MTLARKTGSFPSYLDQQIEELINATNENAPWSPLALNGILIPLSYGGTTVYGYTVTAPGNWTKLIRKGYGFKFNHGGATKYFCIYAIPTYAGGVTTFSITGGSDYTLTNTVFTEVYWSNDPEHTFDFPSSFAFAATYTGFTGQPASPTDRFSISGRYCSVTYRQNPPEPTSNATTFTISLPFPALINTVRYGACGRAVNGGTVLTTPARWLIDSTDVVKLHKDSSGAAWADTLTKSAAFTAVFEY